MISNLILHSPIQINYAKFLNHHMYMVPFGTNKIKYFQHDDLYLIPYRCNSINDKNNLIIGRFIYPIWNTLERVILNKEFKFKYNYIRGDNFTVELTPKQLKNYNIFNETYNDIDIDIDNMICQKKFRMYHKKIFAFNTTLEPNSILLFPIHKYIADVFIQSKLL